MTKKRERGTKVQQSHQQMVLSENKTKKEEETLTKKRTNTGFHFVEVLGKKLS